MADKILLPDLYTKAPLTEVLVDDFNREDTALWTTTTENSGTSTAAISVMTLTTGTTDNNGTYLSYDYGTLGVNSCWEATVRFRTHTAAGDYMIGWILTSNVSVDSIADTGGTPVSGGFQGIYFTSSDLRAVLAATGAAETRQTKQLDWVTTASSTIWRTVRLRLESNSTDAKLFVFNDLNTGTYYPESASRYGMNNFAPVRGYQDPPQVPFAYLENISLHAASHSFICGVKAAAGAATTMSLDYIALAKTR